MSAFAPPETRVPRSLIERVREDWGHKATGAVIALALELLLILVIISLGVRSLPRKEVTMAPTTFDVSEESKKPEPASQAAPAPTQRQATAPNPQPAPPTVAVASQPPAAIIPVSPQQMQSFDISKLAKPAAPKAPAYGPAYSPAFGDSVRVGTAPNGQPMYGASWYLHEPTHQEMAGYLSTAQPGWALITCKTVPDYRVENCVGLDEYPENSHLIESVIAASWQFRVRPPRVNGMLEVGDWVRIRFTYEERAKRSYGDDAGN
jgi:protein TonB